MRKKKNAKVVGFINPQFNNILVREDKRLERKDIEEDKRLEREAVKASKERRKKTISRVAGSPFTFADLPEFRAICATYRDRGTFEGNA